MDCSVKDKCSKQITQEEFDLDYIGLYCRLLTFYNNKAIIKGHSYISAVPELQCRRR